MFVIVVKSVWFAKSGIAGRYIILYYCMSKNVSPVSCLVQTAQLKLLPNASKCFSVTLIENEFDLIVYHLGGSES